MKKLVWGKTFLRAFECCQEVPKTGKGERPQALLQPSEQLLSRIASDPSLLEMRIVGPHGRPEHHRQRHNINVLWINLTNGFLGGWDEALVMVWSEYFDRQCLQDREQFRARCPSPLEIRSLHQLRQVFSNLIYAELRRYKPSLRPLDDGSGFAADDGLEQRIGINGDDLDVCQNPTTPLPLEFLLLRVFQ